MNQVKAYKRYENKGEDELLHLPGFYQGKDRTN
jgi:hypothetical protein